MAGAGSMRMHAASAADLHVAAVGQAAQVGGDPALGEFRLGAASGRAIVCTGATRNSLVVLPLALALPGNLAGAAVIVVTQTLVEVVGMVVYVRVVPKLLSTRTSHSTR